MCGVGSFRWNCVFWGLLGGYVCCWVFSVAISIVGSFTWQYLLYVLGGNVCCWVFFVATCVVVGFRWQCVLLYVLGGNVC